MPSKNKRRQPAPNVPNPESRTPAQSTVQSRTSAAQPTTMSDRSDVVPLIRELERLRESRVIAYYLSGNAQIAFDAMPSFYQQLRLLSKQERIDLWIHSHGGTTEVPWRIVQMVRAHCRTFGVLVTEVAQSAATHIALGADEIVMGPFSLLSPVDPTRQHPLLPQGPGGQPLAISVQDLKHAVEFVNREAGPTRLTADAYAQIITALFDKVHPLALGAIEQSYSLSKLITKRMLATHMDEKKEAEEIQRLADALCDDYKSHQFPIGLVEVQRLGLRTVKKASDDLYNAMWRLLEYYQGIDRSQKPLAGRNLVGNLPAGSRAVWGSIGHLDSTERRIDCLSAQALGPDGVKPIASAWLPLPGPFPF